jgi:hypothetical protein
MPQIQPEQSNLDLTNFVKDLKISDNPFGFKDAVESDTYFVPIPNNFYGFHIDVKDLFSDMASNMQNEINTVDIDYEDLSNQKLIGNEQA